MWMMRAGRQRGRGVWRGGNNRAEPEALTLSLPYGPSIDTINTNTLLIDQQAPTIENAKYVASYNWLNGKDPVILVPGKPVSTTTLRTSCPVFS